MLSAKSLFLAVLKSDLKVFNCVFEKNILVLPRVNKVKETDRNIQINHNFVLLQRILLYLNNLNPILKDNPKCGLH